jgi:hypothetical protein
VRPLVERHCQRSRFPESEESTAKRPPWF